MNARPRVLVVQHDLDDHLNELGGAVLDADIESWCTFISDRPQGRPEDFDAMISLGATAGISQWGTEPWMAVEAEYVRHCVERAKPYLGICFGAQLLAHACGGEVYRAPRHEIGWTEVVAEPAATDDLLLGDFGERYPVFHYHYDTFTLPTDAVLLGRTGDLNQAFRIGQRAWGLQFHIETNPALVVAWLGAFHGDLRTSGADPKSIVADTRIHWRKSRSACWRLADAFAGLITRG